MALLGDCQSMGSSVGEDPAASHTCACYLYHKEKQVVSTRMASTSLSFLLEIRPSASLTFTSGKLRQDQNTYI